MIQFKSMNTSKIGQKETKQRESTLTTLLDIGQLTHVRNSWRLQFVVPRYTVEYVQILTRKEIWSSLPGEIACHIYQLKNEFGRSVVPDVDEEHRALVEKHCRGYTPSLPDP